MKKFDVAIIGGGLVGNSLLCSLNTQGISTALIDIKEEQPITQPLQDNRGIALSLTSLEYLQQLVDLQSQIINFYPIHQVHVSQQRRFAMARLRAQTLGVETLGAVIGIDGLSYVLEQAVQQLPGVEFFRPMVVKKLHWNQDEGYWVIDCENKKDNNTQQLQAKLLVGADGTDSFVRQSLGFSAEKIPYDYQAMVCTVDMKYSHQGIAYQRFCEWGTLGLLPFGHRKMKCVWTIKAQEADKWRKMNTQVQLRRLRSQLGYCIGPLIDVSQPIFYPLRIVKASTLCKEGAVLIGNAANTLSPVGAQGFNLGLRDVKELAQLLNQAYQQNQSINNVELLKRYERHRVFDHQRTHRFTQWLMRPLGRQLGLLACQLSSRVNHWVMKQGLGMTICG